MIRAQPSAVFETLKGLKAQGYNMLVDLTAIDWSAVAAPRKTASSQDEEYGTPRLPASAAPKNPFLEPRPARFEVVYRLMKLDLSSGSDLGREEVRAYVQEGEVSLHSVAALWPIADWYEREVWDMFGIRFADRPDIKRLLLYEEFQGHPLRKDYPIGKRQPLIGPEAGEPADNPSFNRLPPGVPYE